MLRFMTIFSCMVMGSTFANASPLADAVAETKGALAHFADGSERCFPYFDGPAEAHVIYGYGGKELVDPSLSAHPPRYADVRVEKTAKPALLVLSAYEPTVWRIDAVKNANIAGVYLTGYYEQMIVGLPAGIPVGRTHFRFRSEKKKQPCRMAPPSEQGASKNPEEAKQALKTLTAQLSKLRGRTASIKREAIPRSYTRAAVLEEARERLIAVQASDRALATIAEMQNEAAQRVVELRDELGEIENEMAVTSERVQELYDDLKQTQGKGSASPFAKYDYFKTASRVAAFDEALRKHGDISVVSYQTRIKGMDTFVVSKSQSVAYRARKKEGKARLSALKLPSLPVLSSDAPMMTAPKDMIAGDGVKYLLSKGYLQKSGPARDYYCEKARALQLSQGFEPRGGCGYRSARNSYTILGPITFPPGLCGGHSVSFLLPPGVADPKGSPCHSPVIALDSEPCLEGGSECSRKQRWKARQ